MPSKNESLYFQWNKLGDCRKLIRDRNQGAGRSPRSPRSAGNWFAAEINAIR
jgi:hypothetical protein